jgi:dTDP-glucose pyrophosphorylase
MKVVLFCGGLGTRIRDYSESISKPVAPVGHVIKAEDLPLGRSEGC